MPCEEIMRSSAEPPYRFDDVVVDPSNLRLTVGGAIRPVEPKSFRLLQFLIENRDRVVSKDEIFQAVWPDVTVTDNALTRAVAQVRKALDDDPKEPRYIETVPTVGYRFLAAVTTGPMEMPAAAAKPRAARWHLALAALAVVILGGTAIWRFLPRATGPSSLSSAQLTSGAGLDICAAFSPAGNLVAYASDRNGPFEIFVRSLDSSARELQLTSNGNQNLFPAFSPDGQHVAFSAMRGGGIYRVPVLGGSPRRLTDFGAQPAWSPDGKWIVFLSEGSASLATWDYYNGSTESSLWLVPAEGGELRQITGRDHPKGYGQAFPSWSPDGKEIRFVNYLANGECSMWSYRIADGSLRMRFSTGLAHLGSATFARDSRNMYYVTAAFNGDIAIWRQSLNPNTLQPVGAPVVLYRPSVGVPRDLSLAPDGKHLAYSAILSESKLMKLGMSGDSPDGREPEPLTREVSYRYSNCNISPDGKLLAYTRAAKGQPARTFVMSLADGQVVPIGLESEPPQYSPHFSRDGRFVFYWSSKGARSGQWFRSVRLADGAVQTLAEQPPGIGFSAFSPDGTEVAFNNISGSVPHTWKLDFKSGVKTQLTFGPSSIAWPHYSRDGAWLAVQVEQPHGMGQIGLMPASGGPVRIVKDGGVNYANGFSPDDSKIVYAGLENDVWNIYWISIRTHEIRRLTDYHNSRTYVRYPDWALTGDKIVYEFNESKGNVYLGELR
jgi:Tol biopolymer transport system component/DNA-binding winged helix-turn-helix (wHTH) protein